MPVGRFWKLIEGWASMNPPLCAPLKHIWDLGCMGVAISGHPKSNIIIFALWWSSHKLLYNVLKCSLLIHLKNWTDSIKSYGVLSSHFDQQAEKNAFCFWALNVGHFQRVSVRLSCCSQRSKLQSGIWPALEMPERGERPHSSLFFSCTSPPYL